VARPDNRLTRPPQTVYDDGVAEWLKYLGDPPPEPKPPLPPFRTIVEMELEPGEDDGRVWMFAKPGLARR
jgi:hypothetical protein